MYLPRKIGHRVQMETALVLDARPVAVADRAMTATRVRGRATLCVPVRLELWRALHDGHRAAAMTQVADRPFFL